MSLTPESVRGIAEDLRDRLGAPRVRALLQAGSGLRLEVPGWEAAETFPLADIVPFPVHALQGHHHTMTVWRRGDEALLVMNGRFHLYQGYTPQEVTVPVRVAALLGAELLLATNATGAVDPKLPPGSIVVIDDHLNLQGSNPLVGPWATAFGEQFPDMTAAYDPRLREIALEAAENAGFPVSEGVYAAVLGPSFETPAEVRMLRTLGATVVGMSTVPEVIVARHMKMRVLVLSLATNAGAGLTGEMLSHEEVLDAGAAAAEGLRHLLGQLVERLFPA